jgi:hypothetical protein
MLPHQERVIAEKAELDARLAKLLAFIQTPIIFPALPEAEQSRLRNQARFMDGYAAVLGERIAAFKGKPHIPDYEGLQPVPCALSAGGWLHIPHADGKWVTAAQLHPFSLEVIRHWRAEADR